jgi:hypothetical protein
MIAGELEFTEFSFGTASGTRDLISLIFVFLVAIVWFNLMNGLVVGDTEGIRETEKL